MLKSMSAASADEDSSKPHTRQFYKQQQQQQASRHKRSLSLEHTTQPPEEVAVLQPGGVFDLTGALSHILRRIKPILLTWPGSLAAVLLLNK
jgi:hypothetical protein